MPSGDARAARVSMSSRTCTRFAACIITIAELMKTLHFRADSCVAITAVTIERIGVPLGLTGIGEHDGGGLRVHGHIACPQYSMPSASTRSSDIADRWDTSDGRSLDESGIQFNSHRLRGAARSRTRHPSTGSEQPCTLGNEANATTVARIQ